MRIAKLEKNSITNGSGIRVVIWCQGCSLNCAGCHNPQTHDSKGGREFTQDDFKLICKELDKPWVAGVTFSGGHPLEPYNINEVYEYAMQLKSKYPNKTIWLYTGYLFESIKDWSILRYVDVLVDGKYDKTQRNISLPYCGSDNQRVIDVQKTLAEGNIVLYSPT